MTQLKTAEEIRADILALKNKDIPVELGPLDLLLSEESLVEHVVDDEVKSTDDVNIAIAEYSYQLGVSGKKLDLIQDVLKRSGADSMQQIKAFEEIKNILLG